MAEWVEPNFNVDRIREIFAEMDDLQQAGKWTMREWERLREEYRKACDDYPKAMLDFNAYKPGVMEQARRT